MSWKWGFPGGSAVKTPPANGGDVGNPGSIPYLGRSLGEGNGYPLQYSCLENPIDRRAWQATVHGVTKSWTRLSNWACTHVLKVKSRVVVWVQNGCKGKSHSPLWSWGWLGAVPPSITIGDQTACCLLGKRSKFKIQSTVFTESVSLVHYHKVEKLLSWGRSVWPKDSKGPLPLFVNIECSHAHSLHIVPSCFPMSADLTICSSGQNCSRNQKCLLCGPLQKKNCCPPPLCVMKWLLE